MTQFNKGTLFVVLATVVTAILILTTGRDDAAPSKSVHVADDNNSEIIEKPKLEKEAEEVEEVSSVAVEPESTKTEPTMLSEPVEITAPEGPYNAAIETTESEEKIATDAASVIKDSQGESEEIVQLDSINAVATSTQHDLLNHIVQPIWMDQKLGDFKSVEKGEVIFKLMPTNQEGLQGKDPKKVMTSKNDKFAPTTVSAGYNYQQMPMYNGGYYIAPMPPYLMPSVLPTSIDSK